MAKFIVTVKTLKTGQESTYLSQEKKEAVDFANYYRKKNTAKEKKYEVKFKSI